MAKKTYGKPNIPTNVPSTIKTTMLNGLLQKAGVDKVLEKDELELLEKENALRNKLEQLLQELAEKKLTHDKDVSDLINKDLELEKQKEDFSQEKTQFLNQKSAIESQAKEISLQKSNMVKMQHELQTALLQFEEQKAGLEKLKQAAEMGFAVEKQSAIKEKNQVLEQLHQQQLSDLKSSSNLLEQKKKELLERERVLIERESQAEAGFLDKQQQLDQSAQQQQASLSILERRLKQQQQEQTVWETAKAEEIEQNYQLRIQELQANLTHTEKNKKQAFEKISQLTEELAQFEDLKRELSDRGVTSLQSEMENLRIKNRELKEKLAEREESGLLEENKELCEKLSYVDEKLQDTEFQLSKANAQLDTLRMSAQGKNNLLQEKRVLEEHKRLLDISIEQLKLQIDDLSARQQGELPFPALSKMDQQFQHPARGLQAVPQDLAQFAKTMQVGIAQQGLFYSLKDIRLFIAGLAMSKLHLLQGMSGTGKTSLARAFAKSINNVTSSDQEKLYCSMVRVQAGWRDREDLLGHFNAFEKKFYEKEALQAIYRAQQPQFSDTVQIVLLDEMNLSQPEQYFAEFLSLMETPDRSEISLLESPNEKSPRYFSDQRAIKVPQNVWFVGTANHDETTKEFADKTYDRAHVMEIKRSEEKVSANGYQPISYSFNSLQERFDVVCQNEGQAITDIFKKLSGSELMLELEDIKIGWGNRLESHAKKFIPVYQATGGLLSEALDHLLATKLFRSGKVTGRYDTRIEQLQNIESALKTIWKELGLQDEPNYSLQLLRDDIQRKEQGGV
jgi:hypothetical protein